MSNRGERAAEQNQPRKLHKPRRAAGELSPEVMVTYTTECETSSHDSSSLTSGD